MSVDFQTGNLILVENGQLLKETVSEELTQMFQVFAFSNSFIEIVAVQDDCLIAAQHFDYLSLVQTFDKTMNSITIGCNYRKATPPAPAYMNMQARHCDARELIFGKQPTCRAE